MGCTFSGLTVLYDAVNGGGDVWINENRFRIVRQIGESGFAFLFLVKELVTNASSSSPGLSYNLKDPSFLSDDGTYAMKKVLIQNPEQLELVREEIRVSSLFSHPNLLPLLDHAIIKVKATQEQSRKHEAYLLFPVYLEGTLQDQATAMKDKKEFFSTLEILKIFRQLCAGLQHMHNFDPPYAHNDVKPGNVLITRRQGIVPVAILMDFGSACPARREIHLQTEALQLQEWASEHCSAPYRAPELWDCPSKCDIDERTDIWSLGCTLYAIMYGVSPFEYALGEAGGSLQLAVVNSQIWRDSSWVSSEVKIGFGCFCGIALIMMYGKFKLIWDAVKLFDTLPGWNLVSWNSTIRVLISRNKYLRITCIIRGVHSSNLNLK